MQTEPMKYKLTPEQIRHRAAEIIKQEFNPDYPEGAKRIISLLEEATGEKLPEPFDEKRVKDGSVWENSLGVAVVILFFPSDIRAFILKHPHHGPKAFWQNNDYSGICEFLEQANYRYLGQYNFTAGLPKGIQ
jgi:hypothetical protein